MVKIALDPTPFHSTHSLLEFPALAADLGYKYLQMTPHPDLIPFFNHPKGDDDLVKQLKKAVKDAGIENTFFVYVIIMLIICFFCSWALPKKPEYLEHDH